MTSILPQPSTHRRQSSRPNSGSTSSIVTTQQAPSFSSRNGARPPVSGLRSQSPYGSDTVNSNLSGRTLSPVTIKRRSSAVYARPDSGTGFREGVGNLNRWSQSTASSKSSATHNRRNSFSKRLSGSFGSFGGFTNGQSPSPNATLAGRGGRSPNKTPPEPSGIAPPTARPPPLLPPIVTLSSLSQAIDAAESPSTATTVTPATADILSPSIYAAIQPDYFGDRWESRSPSKSTAAMKRPATSESSRANIPSPIAIGPSTSPGSPGPPKSLYSPRTTARQRHAERRRSSQVAHNRNRDNLGKGSGTTEGESSASDHRDRAERPQRRKAPSQKAMLSKALQKAHHAVTLDQHSNYEGAMHAYQEACALLQKVMVRGSGPEDRLKLDAVRNTYEARIAELRGTDHAFQSADGKALPQRPAERDSKDSERLSIVTDDEEGDATPETAMITPSGHDQPTRFKQPHVGMLAHIPPRRKSLQISAYRVEGREVGASRHISDRQNPRIRYNANDKNIETSLHLGTAVYQEYMPPPLSPRRPLSPAPPPQEPTREAAQSSTDLSANSALSDESDQSDSVRKDNGEHTSWLNTINESSGSSSSSVHSRRSSVGLRRKHIRAASGQTEADFDAALDAAVEAAYDDGFEPDDEEEDDDEQLLHKPEYQFRDSESLSHSRRNVELAKENVRETERQGVIAQAKQRERQRLQDRLPLRNSNEINPSEDEDEEEERMLEEMTRDYIMDDSEYDIQTKSALPRESDSSGFSGRTWGSSFGSNPASGTSLSTVAEISVFPSMATQLKDNPLPPPLHPPPSGALPPPPVLAPPTFSQAQNESVGRPPSIVTRNTSPGVRDRRLSGTTRKPLKIEINARLADTAESEAPKAQPPSVPPPMVPVRTVPEPPKSAFTLMDHQPSSQSLNIAQTSGSQPNSRKGSSPFPGSDSTDVASSTASALTKVTSADSDHSVPSMPGSPARFGTKAATGLRKNFSSSSLRNKSLTVTVPEGIDASSTASLSSLSSTPKQRRMPSPAVPVLPTPMESSFITKGQPMGGIYLFDNDIHSPLSPGSPNPLATNAPLPLEPCPESTLLRPFWTLRCIFQTISHSRGGYVSNRLFVPRDIWRVKNIKLKSVEEKVSNCDLLTAALLKLGKVDTLDAGAVLEEMQFFETVMEQVQANLSKKLGNEVGVQGAAQAFKGVNSVDDSAVHPEIPSAKTNNASSKSYLSWRKKRSKNATSPGLTSASTTGIAKDGSQDAPTMKSLPMTTMQNPRFPRRDVNQVQCFGPNPSYMGALARLCDAAQVLDQITRQVEDPGLKHSSQTHVGLELSARHAAEFFGFFVCRFVLTDVGIMLDKFIKRGSEWVLA